MTEWDNQLNCLMAIEAHAKHIRHHLGRLELFLNMLDRHGLPHPTRAGEEIRLTMALCASALETIKTKPVAVPRLQAAE